MLSTTSQRPLQTVSTRPTHPSSSRSISRSTSAPNIRTSQKLKCISHNKINGSIYPSSRNQSPSSPSPQVCKSITINSWSLEDTMRPILPTTQPTLSILIHSMSEPPIRSLPGKVSGIHSPSPVISRSIYSKILKYKEQTMLMIPEDHSLYLHKMDGDNCEKNILSLY